MTKSSRTCRSIAQSRRRSAKDPRVPADGRLEVSFIQGTDAVDAHSLHCDRCFAKRHRTLSAAPLPHDLRVDSLADSGTADASEDRSLPTTARESPFEVGLIAAEGSTAARTLRTPTGIAAVQRSTGTSFFAD